MNNKCKCCGEPIVGQHCQYCGFMNIVALDEAAERKILEEAGRYRKQIIKGLSDFRVAGYPHGWKENESKYGIYDEISIKIADGKDCDGKIFWASQEFAQNPHTGSFIGNIELSYKFNGKLKKVNCAICPVRCDSFWHIGLEITPKLQLVVYLGGKKKYTKSKPLPLSLS